MQVGDTKLPPVSQIGIVVKDIEKSADYYAARFDIGPFSIMEVDLDGAVLRGKPASIRMKVGFAQSGPVQLELIQPLSGDNIYTEFLAAKGEGIHHLGFQVEDFDAMLAAFAREGVEPVFYRNRDGFAFAYMDTEKIGGVMVELLWSGKQGVQS